MNWAAVQAIITLLGVGVTVWVVSSGQSRTHGSLTEKVSEHGRRLGELDDKFIEHDQRIGKVELEAARSEGFRQGVISSQK